MEVNTYEHIKLALRQDKFMPKSERNRLLQLLKGWGLDRPEAKEKPENRIVRRSEAAKRLGVSLRTVDSWAREGILHKVRLPNRQRCSGFSKAEIDKLASGGGDQ